MYPSPDAISPGLHSHLRERGEVWISAPILGADRTLKSRLGTLPERFCFCEPPSPSCGWHGFSAAAVFSHRQRQIAEGKERATARCRMVQDHRIGQALERCGRAALELCKQ